MSLFRLSANADSKKSDFLMIARSRPLYTFWQEATLGWESSWTTPAQRSCTTSTQLVFEPIMPTWENGTSSELKVSTNLAPNVTSTFAWPEALTINAFFLFSDNVYRMYTTADSNYDQYLMYISKPYITFRIKACESVNLVLMPDPQGTWWIDGYEIILGSYGNSKSQIIPGFNSSGTNNHVQFSESAILWCRVFQLNKSSD